MVEFYMIEKESHRLHQLRLKTMKNGDFDVNRFLSKGRVYPMFFFP
jgi:hypothetical protein